MSFGVVAGKGPIRFSMACAGLGLNGLNVAKKAVKLEMFPTRTVPSISLVLFFSIILILSSLTRFFISLSSALISIRSPSQRCRERVVLNPSVSSMGAIFRNLVVFENVVVFRRDVVDNFLVDVSLSRLGSGLWEGRFGGIAEPI